MYGSCCRLVLHGPHAPDISSKGLSVREGRCSWRLVGKQQTLMRRRVLRCCTAGWVDGLPLIRALTLSGVHLHESLSIQLPSCAMWARPS
jgi:hypothetical protein